MTLKEALRQVLRKELDKSADELDAAWSHYYRTGRNYFDRQKIKKLEQEHDAIRALLNDKEQA